VGADGTTIGNNKKGLKTYTNTNNQNNEVKSNTESKNESNTTSSLSENNKTENKIENSTQSNTQSTHKFDNKNESTEKLTRIEKIERVEQGDALAGEMEKLRNYGLIFACAVIAMLCFIAFASLRNKTTIETKNLPNTGPNSDLTQKDPKEASKKDSENKEGNPDLLTDDKGFKNEEFEKKFQMHRLKEELVKTFTENPKIAKQVFSKVLIEEGIQTTAAYLAIFGESVFFEIMKDPSLQNEMSELMDFYAKNPFELETDEEYELLKRADHRTRACKLGSFVQKTTHQFEFLSELDGHQILELVQNESLTVKAIVLTQCDHQKRQTIFNQMDQSLRLQMMNELSRIDYLPREYIAQVAQALKRKQVDNPRLNTENLPASDVLVGLLEKSDLNTQRSTLQSLESSNAETSRLVKSKLISIETLPYLPESRVMDVVLSLKHEEIVTFFKGVQQELGRQILSKTSSEFVSDLEDSLLVAPNPSREIYQAVERKVINAMKSLSQENKIQLFDINQQIFASNTPGSASVTPLRKVG
jgi:flagellar motor switch protein FliG